MDSSFNYIMIERLLRRRVLKMEVDKSMQVPEGWYVVAASTELGKAPISVERFGQSYALWRDSAGRAVMMRDSCPHRSAKLSLGKIQNDCIACPFHGFQFDTSGSCTYVPETEHAAPNLKVATLELTESQGLIWTYFGDKSAAGSSHPWFDELDASFSVAESFHEWPTHITRCVENQLDYAHLPFVHASTIGKNVDVRGKRRIDCDGKMISMYTNVADDSAASIKFIFPNLWLLTILPGKFYQFIAFVPVAEQRTRLYLRAYQKFVTAPVLSSLMNLAMNHSNKVIINQDRAVVLSQEPQNSTKASDELLFPSDRAIKYFRDLWNERLRY